MHNCFVSLLLFPPLLCWLAFCFNIHAVGRNAAVVGLFIAVVDTLTVPSAPLFCAPSVVCVPAVAGRPSVYHSCCFWLSAVVVVFLLLSLFQLQVFLLFWRIFCCWRPFYCWGPAVVPIWCFRYCWYLFCWSRLCCGCRPFLLLAFMLLLAFFYCWGLTVVISLLLSGVSTVVGTPTVISIYAIVAVSAVV